MQQDQHGGLAAYGDQQHAPATKNAYPSKGELSPAAAAGGCVAAYSPVLALLLCTAMPLPRRVAARVRSQPDANAARERRFFWRTSTLFSRRRPPLQPFSRDNLVTGYEARPAQAARTARKKAEILPNLYCAGGTYRFLRKTPFLYTTSPALLLSLTHVTPQQARAAAAPLGVCLRRRTTARRA